MSLLLIKPLFSAAFQSNCRSRTLFVSINSMPCWAFFAFICVRNRTKASVYMYDPDTRVLNPCIHHISMWSWETKRVCSCGWKKTIRAGFKVALLLLLGASHQTEWRSKHLGSWMKGWLFQGWKQEATQQKLCAHTDHMAVSSVDSNNKLCVVHLHIQLSIFSNGAYTAFSTLELYLFVKIFCICPWQSFVMSAPSALLAGISSIFPSF